MTQFPTGPRMTQILAGVILGPAGTCVLYFCTGPLGLHLGSMLVVVGSMLAPFWHYVWPFARKSCHWMGWPQYE